MRRRPDYLTGTEFSCSLSANPVHTGARKYRVRVTIPDSHFHKLWWGHGRGHEQIALAQRTNLSVF